MTKEKSITDYINSKRTDLRKKKDKRKKNYGKD